DREAAGRAGRAGDLVRGRRLRRASGRAAGREARAAVPQAGMIDSHTHLHADPAVAAEWVEAERAVGVNRILTTRTDEESCAAALAAAEAHADVFCAVGLHPNYTTDYAGIDWLRPLASHPRVRAIGETGLDDFRDYAPRDAQERAFADQIVLAREVGK